MATKYRCYLLNNERIPSMQVIECEDDAAAVIEADRILAASPCMAADIWDRDRRVSLISRKNTAA